MFSSSVSAAEGWSTDKAGINISESLCHESQKHSKPVVVSELCIRVCHELSTYVYCQSVHAILYIAQCALSTVYNSVHTLPMYIVYCNVLPQDKRQGRRTKRKI